MQLWQLAFNDLRLTARDRPAAIWLLIFPLLMMWFFSGSGGDERRDLARLAILDRDGGEATVRLLERIGDSPLELVRLDETAAATTDLPLLTIPSDFAVAIAERRPQRLTLRLNPSARPDQALLIRLELLRSFSQTIGRDGSGETDRPRTPIGLSVSHVGSGRPVPSGAAQSVPGMLTFMVLMMTSIYGAAYLTIEKRTGMLKRQALRLSHARILLGKLLGRLLVGGLQTTMLVGGGSLFFGIRWGNSIPAFLLLSLAFLICVAAYSTWLGAILRSPAEASAVGWILSMVLAALGGCWWPAELMPTWLRHLGQLLPTTWAMRGFHALITFGGGMSAVWQPILALTIFAALFTWAGSRRLRLTA